jgi:hypothetical protein
MNTKLKGLMFLSGDVKALADYIDELLASLPKSGVVNGSQYNQVVTLVSTLSEEDSIRRLIKNLNKANGAEAPEAEVEEQAQEEVIHVQQPAEPEAPEPVVETVVEEIPLVAQTVDEEELASMAVPADPFAVVDEVPTAQEQPEPEPAAAVLEELVIPQPTPISSVVAHGVFSF